LAIPAAHAGAFCQIGSVRAFLSLSNAAICRENRQFLPSLEFCGAAIPAWRFALRLLTEKVKSQTFSVNCGLCKIALQELSHAWSVNRETNATLWSPKSIDFSGAIYSGAHPS
jgi:hypothetical protein